MMITTNFNQTLLNNHFDLLRNLSQYRKLELISWLSQSLKSTASKASNKNSLKPLFGAFQSTQNAAIANGLIMVKKE